jgi:soluble lytic murein transglycosylase-like protein
VVLLASAARADVFYYQDADGVFHFTNVPAKNTRPFITERPLTNVNIPDSPRIRSKAGHATYDEIIVEYSERYDLDPTLVKAVIRAESGFNRHAVSPKGARGLMQLMPRTARHWGVRNVYDARENIHGGVRHLRMLMDRYRNNVPRVLAAYNAGVQPVERYRGIPPFPETRTYVSRVLQFRQQYLREQRLTRTVASRS